MCGVNQWKPVGKSFRFDWFVTFFVVATLLYSAAMLVHAYCDGENLAAWVWDRHRNQFSWYSRPLFLIPACYYAYRKKIWLVIGFMAMLFCSLFWFAAPANVSANVSDYLEWEKQLFFSNESKAPLLVLTLVVTGFLVALFSAFWRRKPWLGLVLINAGTVLKIFVGLVLDKESGGAAVAPSLSSLAVINFVAFAVWRLSNTKKSAENVA